MTAPYRRSLGDHFNEGARLLWMALARKGWSQAELARKLGAPSGMVTRWLYGDRRPGLAHGVELLRVLEIPTKAWRESATEKFVVPALKAETAAAAERAVAPQSASKRTNRAHAAADKASASR